MITNHFIQKLFQKTIGQNVGNAFCPVSKMSVESMGGPIQHAYNGKIYNLCCSGCIKAFDREAEKFSRML